MDLDTIREVIVARNRADLDALGPDSAVLAGGTWLFSEPQDRLDRLVDITALDWPALVVTAAGLEIAATCTLAELDEAAEAMTAMMGSPIAAASPGVTTSSGVPVAPSTAAADAALPMTTDIGQPPSGRVARPDAGTRSTAEAAERTDGGDSRSAPVESAKLFATRGADEVASRPGSADPRLVPGADGSRSAGALARPGRGGPLSQDAVPAESAERCDRGQGDVATAGSAEPGADSVRIPAEWVAVQLFPLACRALVASYKIRRAATVGGNVCLGLPAGAVLAALVALDGTALIWSPDGGERSIPLARFVIGPGQTVLRPGEVLRSIRLDAAKLRSRIAFRKVALAPLGRSGAVVMGRRDADGRCAITLSAATVRPVVLEFGSVPDDSELAATILDLDRGLWFDDPHGTPAWRRHVCTVLGRAVLADLGEVRS
ncbi:FAD binding domain-containing protein [Nocardia aurantia]|uniref:FAD-binding PCMH-type domain-containing protein n=1 Tax=Nocardia aurantia TaxID=2585199 RepID=A0A7K0DWH5_9NOCA|nr:FAD binding domain-containing protein [Nocardia aurantia]MQY30133.1 hypothetical protein [Nocardia aurantia]